MASIDDTLERIQKHKGVDAVFILNTDGRPAKSLINFNDGVHPARPAKIENYDEIERYAAALSQFTDKCRSVIRDIDPQNDLKFVRVRSKKHEIMVSPDKDFYLAAIQDMTIALKP